VPENIKAELATSDLVGLAAAALVLLVAFGSVVAMGLPILIAVVGLAVGTAGVSLYAAATTVGSMAPTVATMIGLGVGIDYALFLTSRHRQYLSAGYDVPEAAGQASGTAGRAVLVAGVTVMVSICGLALVGVPNLATFGYASAIVVAVMVAAALTLLPALLGLAGTRLDRLRVPRLGRERSDREPASARWAGHVGRHPAIYAIGCLALLLTVASPVLSMRMAQSDASSEPTSTTHRRAYDALAAAFGPGANGPLLVVVDLRGARTDPTPELLAAVGRDADVAAVAPTGTSPAGTAAVLTVIPRSGPQSERHGSGSPAGRADGRLHRRVHPAVPADAVVHGSGRRDVVPAAARRLPLGAGPAEGGGNEPALDRGVLRRAGGGLPVGLGAPAARAARHGPDLAVPAGVDVRRAVRPVDGLRGLPAQPDPRGLPAQRELAYQRRLRADRYGAGHHLRRSNHDLRVPQLHPRPRDPAQDDRPGAGDRGAARRDRGADGAGPRHDGAARPGQLVAAGLAGPGAAAAVGRWLRHAAAGRPAAPVTPRLPADPVSARR